MSDRRDLRDPQKLGEAYQLVRQKGLDIDTAVRMPVENYINDEGVIERYGRPDQLEPVWAHIQVA